MVQSGAFGEGTYTLDDKGIMTLTGPGKLVDQGESGTPDGELVKYLVVEEGVTSVGGTASNFPNLLYASYPSTIDYFKLQSREQVTAVVLAEGISKIENDAFQGCKSLRTLTLPSTVSRIGMRAFAGTAITSIELPERMNYIDNAFCNTPLESLRCPAGVDTIYPGTFNKCPKLTSITIPKDVTDIREYAFLECGLKDVYYQGTEEEFKAIKIGEGNEDFLNAEIHYNAE